MPWAWVAANVALPLKLRGHGGCCARTAALERVRLAGFADGGLGYSLREYAPRNRNDPGPVKKDQQWRKIACAENI